MKDYFHLILKEYLKDTWPELSDNEAFINERAKHAQDCFGDKSREGLDVSTSLELSRAVLFEDLDDSRYSMITELSQENFPEYKFSREQLTRLYSSDDFHKLFELYDIEIHADLIEYAIIGMLDEIIRKDE